jgi:DNA-directed RNA polymerase specialized sigma24 family protein
MTDERDLYGPWKSTVRRVAGAIARDYPDSSFDDIAQDLWVEIYKEGWESPNPGLAAILKKVATRKAMEYRAQALVLSAQYSYQVRDVRKILDRVFEYRLWAPDSGSPSSDPDKPLRRGGGEPSYSMDDQMTTYSDVKRAWERLPVEYRRIIFEKHVLGEEFERGSGRERTYYRAVARLTDVLNSYQPRRTAAGAVSNSKARYILEQQG